ncbi:MAG: ABC transporter permease [Desulfovibrionales bacterium]
MNGETGIWLQRMKVMLVKEFQQFFRDIVLILFMLYAFTLNIYMAGSGVRFEVRNASVAVLDNDRSHASRDLVDRFRPPAFDVAYFPSSEKEAMQLLDEGQAMVVLDIPAGFSRDLAGGDQVQVQIQVDTTNTVMGTLASGYASRIVAGYGQELARKSQGLGPSQEMRVPGAESAHRIWYNPSLENSWFMALTQLLNFITLFAILLPAAAMVREKEKGTVEQLLVTPLSPFQIMFPKVAAMAVLILAGTALSLYGVMGPAFDLPVLGSALLFFGVTGLYVFAIAGLGLLISTFSSNQGQAGLLTILIFGPMIMLSGAWTPPEAMPDFMHLFLKISPLHYYLNASFGILLKGSGLSVLLEPILGIGLFGSVIFGLGMWRLRRQFG